MIAVLSAELTVIPVPIAMFPELFTEANHPMFEAIPPSAVALFAGLTSTTAAAGSATGGTIVATTPCATVPVTTMVTFPKTSFPTAVTATLVTDVVVASGR
jgi:hypothetical protein